MTYTFRAVAEATILTITQEDPREPGADQAADDEVSEDEENPVLDALKKLAESMETSTPEE